MGAQETNRDADFKFTQKIPGTNFNLARGHHKFGHKANMKFKFLLFQMVV